MNTFKFLSSIVLVCTGIAGIAARRSFDFGFPNDIELFGGLLLIAWGVLVALRAFGVDFGNDGNWGPGGSDSDGDSD